MRFNQIKEYLVRLKEYKNKKIVIIFSTALAALALWSLWYLPARRSLVQLKTEFNRLENKIYEIEKGIDGGPITGSRVKLLKTRVAELEAAFPAREGEIIKQISDLAKKFSINLISIRPQAKRVFTSPGQEPVIINGRPCEKLFVSYRLEASFFDLAGYLRSLREELPATVIVEVLNITRPRHSRQELDVNMGINIFLLPKQ